MTVVCAPLPEDLVRTIDETARTTNQSRADVIRKAVELYLSDVRDQWSTLDRMGLPTGLAFDWEDVKTGLLGKD